MSGVNFNSHVKAAKVENARWLLDDVKLSLPHVARRLGMTEDAVQKMLGRAHAEPDTDAVEGDRRTA